MARDLSKGLMAQKSTEDKSKSKFGKVKEELKINDNNPIPQPVVKITASITQKNWDHLHKILLERSQKTGKYLNKSQILRLILDEHESMSES